jgi:hypothetical protein
MWSILVARSQLLTLVLTVVGGAAEAADVDTIVLSASGSEGARVRGRCVLRQVGGNETIEINEAVPFERRWEGVGLRCELEAQGRVTVEAVRGGSRSSVSGGRMTIEVR